MKRPNKSGPHAEFGKQRPGNTQRWTGGGRIARFASRIAPHSAAFVMTFMVCATGCSFLKPVPDTSRHFVLTSLPAPETAKVVSGASRVDVVHVKIPPYVFNSSLAVRKGSNEIVYPPGTLWAERLDTGIPRVLAADLSSLLPSELIRVDIGSSEDVAREIGVIIEQFDVSSSGQAVLVAKWRVYSPKEEVTLRSGESRLSRTGPAPDTDPSGAVGTLSELLADLSRQLAQALNDASLGAEATRQAATKDLLIVWKYSLGANMRLAFESSPASHTGTNTASRIQDGSLVVPYPLSIVSECSEAS